jgi:hypothetical protein
MIPRRVLLSLALAAPAQAQGRVARLGLLSSGQISIDQFRQWGLPELAREGFIEGRSLSLIARTSNGDAARLTPLAAEILDDFRGFLPRFWLVKPKAAGLDSLINALRRAA